MILSLLARRGFLSEELTLGAAANLKTQMVLELPHDLEADGEAGIDRHD